MAKVLPYVAIGIIGLATASNVFGADPSKTKAVKDYINANGKVVTIDGWQHRQYELRGEDVSNQYPPNTRIILATDSEQGVQGMPVNPDYKPRGPLIRDGSLRWKLDDKIPDGKLDGIVDKVVDDGELVNLSRREKRQKFQRIFDEWIEAAYRKITVVGK